MVGREMNSDPGQWKTDKWATPYPGHQYGTESQHLRKTTYCLLSYQHTGSHFTLISTIM
jgi:hypothetical protein